MNEEIKERLEQIRRGELPNGYRRTKAGIMPLDWCAKREYTAKELFRSVAKRGGGEELDVLSATQDNGVIPRNLLDIDIKYDKENLSNYKRVEKGDFVISLRSFQGGIEYSLYDGLISPAYTVMKPIHPISAGYYKAYFKTDDFISRLNRGIYGIRDGKQVSFTDFGDFYIHCPPLAEQQRIADILSAQDTVIELKERLVAEKLRQKKYLMQRLLTGKQRLPGFFGEWKTIQIGDDEYTRIDPEYLSTNTSADYKFTYITLESVDNGRLVNTLQCEYSTAPSRARKIIRYMDVLFGMVRPNLHSHLFVDNNDGDICSTGFCVIRCNQKELNPRFLYYHLFSDNTDKQVDSFMVGSNYPAVSADNVKHLKIGIPADISEQRAIADILSAADREIELLRASLEQEKRKKKALSQLLLTGIVRV